MGKVSKLLNKPFRAFTFYALIVLVCSIPVYYLVVDFIWISELDEHNQIIRQRIEKRFDHITINEQELTQTLDLWNTLQPGTRLVPASPTTNTADSVYTILTTVNAISETEVERLRVLSSYIIINERPYHLTVETNIEEVDETLLAIALVTFLFFSLLAGGFIILNRRIANGIWKPFRNTLDKVKKFDLLKGQPIQFQQTDIEEFEELNSELSKLIDRNIAVFNGQKRFIENASHELQTPLAVLKSKTEMLLQQENLTEKQAELINAINIPLGRVSRINKNLLLLAKIENDQFVETEQLDLSLMLTENSQLLDDYIQGKGLRITTRINDSTPLLCNKTLLEILINNLLINAVIHSPNNGELQIEFSERKLTISNSGNTPLNKQNLFNRFAIVSSESANSGLGLAISKEICNRFHWTIHYSFSNNLHSFSVQFS